MENGATRQSILAFAEKTFGTKADFPFAHVPGAAVLRDGENNKWYGLIIGVSRKALGLPGGGTADVLNVKAEPLMLGSLLMQKGFLPAYHMNKSSWLSVLLDGTVPQEQAENVLRTSYALVHGKGTKKSKRTQPRCWLIPANPKYITLSELFRTRHETLWKQSSAFIAGDTVYIYEGMPIGAVTHVCEVTAVDIPHHSEEGGLRMDTAMRLRLTAKIPGNTASRARLLDFGVQNIRGARGIPDDLLQFLKGMQEPV